MHSDFQRSQLHILLFLRSSTFMVYYFCIFRASTL